MFAILVFVAAVDLGSIHSLAVMPVNAKGVRNQQLPRVLDDLILSAVQRQVNKGTSVVGKSDIDAQLGLDKLKNTLGCADTSCMAEIAGALGADTLLAPTLGTLGAKHLLTLVLIRTKGSLVLARHTETLGKNEEEFDAGIKRATAKLFAAEEKEEARVHAATLGQTDQSPVSEAPADTASITAGEYALSTGGTLRLVPSKGRYFAAISGGQGGVALRYGETLAIALAAGRFGVVVYEKKGSSLRKVDAVGTDPGTEIGVEELEGPLTLDGDYNIVVGMYPNGVSYSGNVKISARGDHAYSLTWTVPKVGSYNGAGLAVGNRLVVMWHQADQGVLHAFRRTPEGWSGAALPFKGTPQSLNLRLK